MLDEKRFQLSRMEKVELRDVWPNEASDFTPWLADNLSLLGETIDAELVLEAQEKNVGSFRADIIAKNAATEDWVLVENQLDITDHKHMGQIITYAAGLKALTVVWIARRFTDEHRTAIDWLNEITTEGVNFFALEIELWKVGDQIAPKLNIICKPNSWAKKALQTKRSVEASAPAMSKQRQAILSVLRDNYPRTMTPIQIVNASKGVLSAESIRVNVMRMKNAGLIVSPSLGEYTLPEVTQEWET